MRLRLDARRDSAVWRREERTEWREKERGPVLMSVV